jgi:hypothetical protein
MTHSASHGLCRKIFIDIEHDESLTCASARWQQLLA